MNRDKKYLGTMIFACRALKRSKNSKLKEIGDEVLPRLMKEWRWMEYRIDEIPKRWYQLARFSSHLESTL